MRVSPVHVAVLPPAPVPYREPLFAALADRQDLRLDVVYLTDRPAGWDMADAWFTSGAPRAYAARTLTARQRARRGRTPIVTPRSLPRALTALTPDVVVAWEFGPAALLARAWCTARGRALAHFTELGAVSAASLPAPQRRLHAALARRADALIGASTQARDRLIGIGGDPRRAFVSLQSVEAETIRHARAARLPRPAERPFELLSVARLVPDKNLDGLIRACAGVPGLELHVVGEGPRRGSLTELAATCRVDLRLHGALTPNEIAERYATADAFALVSRHEPFGVALREAAAAGLPLIASQSAGAVGDIAVAGRNALIVDPHDVGAIAEAVLRLHRDPAERARLAVASRQLDAEWPLSRSVESFADAVLAAAAQRPRRTGTTRWRRVASAASRR